MTDETIKIAVNTEEDGDKVAKEETKNETETKTTNQPKQRSVSFNRDVHVKRFGKPREPRGALPDHQVPAVRREPFTYLSKPELIAEANKVLAQADSVTCTTDHSPERFFSLPHRKKLKQESLKNTGRRNSEDSGDPKFKKALGRSTSDVGSKKNNKDRTSLSTLFRRAQRNKSPDLSVPIAKKPATVVKRSKSDVSDLKSNTKLNTQIKPIRKRSGSETEEFLKSLRNKKVQLSPIIENSPREDYFKKTSPLDKLYKQKLVLKESNITNDLNENNKINPIIKPPRYKIPETQIDPKPPARSRRSKYLNTDKRDSSPPITETPKRSVELKKTLLVDEIDNFKGKEVHPIEIKDRIKDSIKKIQENVYGDKNMIHSSQQPPDKPPLTRGHTVDHIVRILKEDQFSPPPKAHLILPLNNGSNNNNQPFSYIKPSVSPDPNLYIRNTSPDRVLTPINKINNEQGVVYAQVVRGDRRNSPSSNMIKQTVHKTYSQLKDKYDTISDEDEGLGYEEQKRKLNENIKYDYNKSKDSENYNNLTPHKITDSPIKPRFREYKLTTFNDFEPTYANDYPLNEDRPLEYITKTIRGRGDGMDSKRRIFNDPDVKKEDPDFNELSHRRQLLESRLNARRHDRDKGQTGETLTRYITETDPIYEAEKRMKATEKYVNETAKYYHHTLEKENSVTENYSKYNNDNQKSKFLTEKITSYLPRGNSERKVIHDPQNNELNTFIENKKMYPPEPEYEPPSLELPNKNAILTPDEYKEKKYKVKSKQVISSQDTLQTNKKYFKGKDAWYDKRKDHYASNPEIAQVRDEDYVNADYYKQRESYHNSLKRGKNRDIKDGGYKEYIIKRRNSEDEAYVSRDDRSPRRFDIDNRLVDSGIENDFRKYSSGDIHKTNTRYKIHDSDDDVRDTSLFLANERRHAEDNYPSEQTYINQEYLARFKDFDHNKTLREDYGGTEKLDKTNVRNEEKVSAKPPKAVKKLSGLEKMKQLFSRDSSKKSKKEQEPVQNKPRTRVLKSPEHLDRRDSDYRRYKDPEPSDDDVRRDYDPKGSDTERRYRSETKELHPKQRSYRDSDEEYGRYDNEIREERFRRERANERKYISSDRDTEHKSPRTSDVEHKSKSREPSRKSRSMTADSLDSPAMAERYRERRRLATPSPTPSPPRRAQHAAPPQNSGGNWFKSLDRLTRKRSKNTKFQKDGGATTEDESLIAKNYKSKTNSPAKNLRFFGDTDQDSDANHSKHGTIPKSHNNLQKKHTTLRKTISNSSTGIDELDHSELPNKSYSLTNLNREDRSAESPRTRPYYKRNLHNISEIHSNSENESNFDRKVNLKPPMSPYDRRSRSQSSSKAVGTNGRKHGSITELRHEDRSNSSEIRGSKQELNRNIKQRRRTPTNNSGESSTEGESSHQSQRSIVYLHATTVGDIPDPGRVTRNRSRDDVSSVNSSQVQVRTTAKSFSLFAPWTPRHYSDQHDVHYAQKPRRPSKPREITHKKTSSTKDLTEDKSSTLQKNKSYSQTSLSRRPQNHRLTSSSMTLYKKPEKESNKENLTSKSTLSRTKNISDTKMSQSTEVLNRDKDRRKFSRSISMPKDNNKKAGWFKISNKNKKPEANPRVR